MDICRGHPARPRPALVPREPHCGDRASSRRLEWGVARAELADPDDPYRLRSIDRRYRIVAGGDENSHRRLTRIASVHGHHAVRPCAPIDPVRQNASGAVIELQRQRHRRRGWIHRGQCARLAEPAQRLRPRIRQAQHRSRCRPTDFGRGLRWLARVDIGIHRRRRRSRAAGQTRRALPVHHLVSVDRLAVGTHCRNRDRDSRTRRRTGLGRQRNSHDERHHSRRP